MKSFVIPGSTKHVLASVTDTALNHHQLMTSLMCKTPQLTQSSLLDTAAMLKQTSSKQAQ